jgi:hypothetical protein
MVAEEAPLSDNQVGILRALLAAGVVAVLTGDAALWARAREADVQAPKGARVEYFPAHVVIKQTSKNVEALVKTLRELGGIKSMTLKESNDLEQIARTGSGAVTIVPTGRSGPHQIEFSCRPAEWPLSYDKVAAGSTEIDVGHDMTFPVATVEVVIATDPHKRTVEVAGELQQAIAAKKSARGAGSKAKKPNGTEAPAAVTQDRPPRRRR